jgi:hypothetical protein
MIRIGTLEYPLSKGIIVISIIELYASKVSRLRAPLHIERTRSGDLGEWDTRATLAMVKSCIAEGLPRSRRDPLKIQSWLNRSLRVEYEYSSRWFMPFYLVYR